MSDLIDRQDAINAVLAYRHSILSAEEIIETVPSAQPEIIRCRDCAYRGAWQCPMYYEDYDWDMTWDMTEDDGFCHVAKKGSMEGL